MDFALHEQLATESDISAVLMKCWNWPGIRAASDAAALADSRSESVLESVSRLKLVQFDIECPEPQQLVRDQGGQPVGRVDFGWAELGVVGEADGLGKYAEHEVLTAEKIRQESLEQLGLVVVRWVGTRSPGVHNS